MQNNYVFDSREAGSIIRFRDALCSELYPLVKENRPIIFLCIGTDRSTGDCLGPLVGEKLKFMIRENIFVYGNLEQPIHAKNLCETLDDIKQRYINPYIVA